MNVYDVFIYDNFCGYSEVLKVKAETPKDAEQVAKLYMYQWQIDGCIEKITKI